MGISKKSLDEDGWTHWEAISISDGWSDTTSGLSVVLFHPRMTSRDILETLKAIETMARPLDLLMLWFHIVETLRLIQLKIKIIGKFSWNPQWEMLRDRNHSLKAKKKLECFVDSQIWRSSLFIGRYLSGSIEHITQKGREFSINCDIHWILIKSINSPRNNQENLCFAFLWFKKSLSSWKRSKNKPGWFFVNIIALNKPIAKQKKSSRYFQSLKG